MANRRQSWPYLGQASSPPALTLSPDGLLRSDRGLAGPGRISTTPEVGARGAPPNGIGSDFGMDRVSPRRIDPLGDITARTAPAPASRRIRRD